jgi:hypothetical protein
MIFDLFFLSWFIKISINLMLQIGQTIYFYQFKISNYDLGAKMDVLFTEIAHSRFKKMEISRPSLRDSNNKLSCVGMGKLN